MPTDLGLTTPTSVARTGSTDAWVNPNNSLSSNDTYTTAGPMGEGDKTELLRFVIPAPGTPFVSLPSHLTLTIEAQVDPDTEAVVDVIFDVLQLGTASGPAGTNVATPTPLPVTDNIIQYAIPTDGITLTQLNAGDARLFVACKALPETPYSGSDFAITYDCDGNQTLVATGYPDIDQPWTDPTPPLGTVNQVVSRSGGESGGGSFVAEQQGTVDINVSTGTSNTYVVLNVDSNASAGGGGAGIVTIVDSDNGIGTTPSVDPQNSISDGTAKRKVRITSGNGTLPIEASANVTLTYNDSDIPGDPGVTALFELSAAVVLPDDATVKIDYVKLEAPDSGSSVLFDGGHPYRRRFYGT